MGIVTVELKGFAPYLEISRKKREQKQKDLWSLWNLWEWDLWEESWLDNTYGGYNYSEGDHVI